MNLKRYLSLLTLLLFIGGCSAATGTLGSQRSQIKRGIAAEEEILSTLKRYEKTTSQFYEKGVAIGLILILLSGISVVTALTNLKVSGLVSSRKKAILETLFKEDEEEDS